MHMEFLSEVQWTYQEVEVNFTGTSQEIQMKSQEVLDASQEVQGDSSNFPRK